MKETLLELLRCPFCGTRLSVDESPALVRANGEIRSGVLGCECCAFPIVEGIPVLVADDRTRDAMHAMEAGHHEQALFLLLQLDDDRGRAFRELLALGERATYREALGILSVDAEGTYFVHRFSDPTFILCEALVTAVARGQLTGAGRILDLCGGSGHLTRTLSGLQPAGGTVLADFFFWKLWLASRFTAPECSTICCDANLPLPFARDTFSLVVLADAFPYIWHKRLLAEEMIRLAGGEGTIVMPHLHSSLGDNFSAGDTLTPSAYENLFATHGARLFSDARLFSQVMGERVVDLSKHVIAEDLGTEPSFTLVASNRPQIFRRYEVPESSELNGELRVNPLYTVERSGSTSILRLTFPTAEYEEEFGDCRQYLPDQLTIDADVTGKISPSMLGTDYADLRRRRVIIDLPARYV